MKKYILHSLLMTALAAGIVSCQEKADLFSINVPDTVDVVSGADIAFKARGGEGDIEVTGLKGELKATTEVEWCHLTVDGNKIHVVVDNYAGLESRYATVNLASGDATGKTTVHQYGVIVRSNEFKNVNIKNPAREIKFFYDANETLVEATTEADWLTISCEADTLRLTASENVSKEYRQAVVNWNIGQMHDSFTVVQFDIAEAGLLGDWSFTGMGGTNFRTPYNFNATLSEEANTESYRLRLVYGSNMDLTIENVTITGTTLLLPLGDMIGRRGNYYVFPVVRPGTGTIAWSGCIFEGVYPILLYKEEGDSTWKGMDMGETLYNAGDNFSFEMWTSEDHTGNSGSRLVLRNLTMVKK